MHHFKEYSHNIKRKAAGSLPATCQLYVPQRGFDARSKRLYSEPALTTYVYQDRDVSGTSLKQSATLNVASKKLGPCTQCSPNRSLKSVISANHRLNHVDGKDKPQVGDDDVSTYIVSKAAHTPHQPFNIDREQTPTIEGSRLRASQLIY